MDGDKMYNNYILMIAFGEGRYKEEALYSVFSLLSYKEDCLPIILMSDDVSFFSHYFERNNRVIFEQISDEQLTTWYGDRHFLFRIKICALNYCFHKYKANILYVDTDTVFIHNIDSVISSLEKTLFLYGKGVRLCDEYSILRNSEKQYISNSKYRTYLNKKRKVYDCLVLGMNIGKLLIKIDNTFVYRNAGVIGIPYNDHKLLERVLSISDIIYKQFQFELSEEIAFNLVFQSQENYKYIEIEKNIYHYSSQEVKFSKLLTGYVGKCLINEDKQAFYSLMSELHIADIDRYQLTYEDIPSFVGFLISFTNICNYFVNSDIQRFNLEKDYLPSHKEKLVQMKKYMKIYSIERN